MTSLNDIPLVGNVVNRVEDAAVDAAILRLRYLLFYKSLVKALKTEVDKLKIEEDAVSRKADAERDDGKIIKDHVIKWQQDVENIKMIVENLFERYEHRPSWLCFKDVPFAKPVSRFRLGKQAAEDAKTVTELTNLGKEYRDNDIAHHPPKENVPISDTPYQSFQSRQEAYVKLWEALIKEDGYPILGIYGMPGVGKTRMMEEAWKQAKEKGIFRKVARANVGGGKVDLIKLQDQLAGYLDCHLEPAGNLEHRASQLKNSLMNGGKTLIILDDVWDVIALNKIGISFGDGRSKGSKILYTSRRRDICFRNNCEDPVEIKTLTENEAWHMFEEAVGTSKIESLQEPLLAEKVCKKCGTLPLLVNAVANALKFMTENSWKDALYQLENCRFEEIDGIEPHVYSCLLLSFEKLTEAAKTCLLLCSLFQEDADIDIQKLSNLATGSQLLDRQRNIGGIVDILKLSSLLLQGKYDSTVKLHDVIRDVARTIAAKDSKYAFLSIRCRLGWPDCTDYHTRRLLHLDLKGKKKKVSFPNDLLCPDLHTLWLECKPNSHKLSSGFFQELTNPSFLLQVMKSPEQLLYIHKLEKLRMIIIDGCNIDVTFFSSVSQNVETLCIENCDFHSPLDLSKLKNLRKLELLHKVELKMVPESISSLLRLEELIIPRGFTIWEDADVDPEADTDAKADNDSDANADTDSDADVPSIYAELNKLTRLRNLTITLPCSQSYLDGDIVSNLQEFDIYMGTYFYHRHLYLPKKSIHLGVEHIESGWMTLIKEAEKVYLEGVEDLFKDSKQIEAFADLKKLKIVDCEGMDYLVRLPLDRRNQKMEYFSNLRSLNITCQGLTYLFPVTVAKCLLKIEKLKVKYCDDIEEIVQHDYGSIDHGQVMLSFSKLKVLHLEYLPSFKRFSTHKVAFPSLEELWIDTVINASEIWGKGIYNHEDISSFHQLRVLRVYQCEKLENVIPFTYVHQVKNLEHVYIDSCESLKTVFQRSSIARDTGSVKEIDGERIEFLSLRKLELRELPDIKSFWSYDGETVEVNSNQPKVSFPNLEDLQVSQCEPSGWIEEIELGRDDDSPSKLICLSLDLDSKEVLQFIPSRWELQLQNLHSLYFSNCMLHGKLSTPKFTRIGHIQLINCELGPTLFRSSSFRSFQQLRRLVVRCCDLLEEIVEDDSKMEDEKTISLPALELLTFQNLPSLKSFSRSSNYDFNMPALASFYLKGCPRVEKFTSLPINAPLLEEHNGGFVSNGTVIKEKDYIFGMW